MFIFKNIACSALALDQFCCWFAFMQVGGWMYLWHDKEVTNDGRAASWWVDLSMAGKEVTNHGRARNECSMWSGRSCLNNEEMCRWFFWLICLIRFEHRSIMWFICFDAWWWRILSMHGRPAGYQCLSISNCWPKFSWAGCTVSAAGRSGWSSLNTGQVLKAAGQVSSVGLSFNGARFLMIWLIIFEWNIMWLICFDAWWWRVLSTHGRAAGYHCLNIIRNSLICLLMSESVCGRPSFMHLDAWNGVWQGRSLHHLGFACAICGVGS